MVDRLGGPGHPVLEPVLTPGGTAAATERRLLEARRQNPTCRAIYFALYRFYRGANRLDEAEATLRCALREAARQGGFTSDWTLLNRDNVATSRLRAGEGPVRFFCAALKALAGVKRRRRFTGEARAILAKLEQLTSARRWRDETSG
ncbi:hypothetical protein [Candidatus Methylocalor cossyra]|uniref:Tetratricopeptide repeat protein n=1 Tax=Candidatus Methylocalor cossyra TaxID=3108543 RepID=A0ABP1C6I1_9GAMM